MVAQSCFLFLYIQFKDPDSEENLYDTWVRKHNKDKNDNRREPK